MTIFLGWLHAFRSSFTLLGQRIKVVTFLVQKAFFHQLLDSIEDRRALIRIIAAGFEQLMQVESFLAPVVETCKHSFFNFVHRKDNSEKVSGLLPLLFHLVDHRSHVGRNGAPFGVQQRWIRRCHFFCCGTLCQAFLEWNRQFAFGL